MMKSNINQYLETFHTYPPLVMESAGEESSPPSNRVSEDVVKLIWMEQPWAPSPIRDTAGNLIEIISPGWFNGGAGPDFRSAIYRYNGGHITKADVEIHVRSSDWERHKHHKDPAYNKTRLHVALFCDVTLDPRKTDSGVPLIEIELDHICHSQVDKIRSEASLKPAMKDLSKITGQCGSEFSRIGETKSIELVKSAGLARLDLKSRRYTEAIRKGAPEDQLYRGLFEAFGYHVLKSRFSRIATAAPLEVLRQVMVGVDWRTRPIVLQAILFKTAGLLPQADIGDYDDETVRFLVQLREVLAKVVDGERFYPVEQNDQWTLKGIRPAGMPWGRLAGLSYFLALHVDSDLETLFRRVLDDFPIEASTKNKREWMAAVASKLFPAPKDSYWSFRYKFGGKRLAKPRNIVGRDRVEILFINVVLPLLLARAREQNRKSEERWIQSIYDSMPGQAINSTVRFMADRLTGASSARFTANAIGQQGLLQIYTDFCMANALGCEGCRFVSYIKKL